MLVTSGLQADSQRLAGAPGQHGLAREGGLARSFLSPCPVHFIAGEGEKHNAWPAKPSWKKLHPCKQADRYSRLPPGSPVRAPGCGVKGKIKLLIISSELGPSGSGQTWRAWCRFLGCLFRLLPQLFLPLGSGDQLHHIAPAAATTGCRRVPCQDADPSCYNLELVLNVVMSFGDFPVLTHSARASELQHRSSLCTNAGLCPCSGRRWFIVYDTGFP